MGEQRFFQEDYFRWRGGGGESEISKRHTNFFTDLSITGGPKLVLKGADFKQFSCLESE